MVLAVFVTSETAPDKAENLITKWSIWTTCSQSCGNHGRRKRVQYECASSSQEITDCDVSGEQEETCVLKPCPGTCIISPELGNSTRFSILCYILINWRQKAVSSSICSSSTNVII